jgi:hypothetical protein
MGPLNTTLNQVNSWSSAGIFKREILSRTTNIVVTLPTEVIAICQNAFQSVTYAGSAILKTAVHPIACISGSEIIKKFEAKLPGFRDMLKAISRIVAYAFGCLLTATFGVIYPAANFKMHCNLGLVHKIKTEIKTEESQQDLKDKIIEDILMQNEKMINETIEKEIAEVDLAETKELIEEILKEEETKEEETLEVLKKTINENGECINQINVNSQEVAEAANSPIQKENEVEENQSSFTAEVSQQNISDASAKQPKEKTYDVVRNFFNKQLGKDGYHYYDSVGIIIPKTPIEKARDYISNKINDTWNKFPNIKERISSLRANNS